MEDIYLGRRLWNHPPMPFRITDHPDGSVFAFQGAVIPFDIIEAFRHAAAFTEPTYRWSVWDYSGIDNEGTKPFWDGFMVASLSQRIDPMIAHQTWPHRCPHVTSSELIRSLVVEYAKITQRPKSHDLRIFSSVDAALAWARGGD